MNHSAIRAFRPLAVAGLGVLLLAACGGGGGGGVDTTAGYTVGGTITGLASGASVTLETAGATPVVRSENGAFTFNQRYGTNSPYRVRVTDHTGWDIQGCDISNASGTISNANITNVLVQCYDQVLLSAGTGFEQITLRWTRPFEPEPMAGMLICMQDVSGIPNDDPDHLFDTNDHCIAPSVPLDLTGLTLANGRYERVHVGLNNNNTYFYQVRMKDGGKVVYSNVAFTSPRVPWDHSGDIAFNDTGITECSDGDVSDACPAALHPAQDAEHGRDKVVPSKAGFGDAGFDYTRIAADSRDQSPVPGSVPGVKAANWACIRDNVSGLTWELRPNLPGHLRHRDWRYTWFNDDGSINGGSNGVSNGILCGETLFGCNTQRYVERVNALGLCGYTDWRLPTQAELYSILHFGKQVPAADPQVFPDVGGGRSYWSSTPGSTNTNLMWDVRFQGGLDGTSTKQSQYAIRLVREDDTPFPLPATREAIHQASGQTCRLEMYPTAPSSGFDTGVAAGYACQKGMGLLWRRCPVGWNWDGGECVSATPQARSWSATLTQVAGFTENAWSDWRLPNIKELNSIIERRCSNPAVDTRVFPVVPTGDLWSASPVEGDPTSVWTALLNTASGGDAGSGGVDLGFAFIVRDVPIGTCPP